MLEESCLGVHLDTAKADAKMASAKAKRSAHRLDELTAKEDKARCTRFHPFTEGMMLMPQLIAPCTSGTTINSSEMPDLRAILLLLCEEGNVL